jgi:hypothetical protein
VGAVGLVAGYAENQANQDASQESMEEQIKAQKELAAQKRQWELQDRQYRQNAVGGWAKYLDPKLVGGSSVAPATAGSGNAPGPNAPAKDLATTDENGMPITDPNNPLFAPNQVTPGTNVIPMNYPAQFQGMNPRTMGNWSFAQQFPNYDFFNPNPNYGQ